MFIAFVEVFPGNRSSQKLLLYMEYSMNQMQNIKYTIQVNFFDIFVRFLLLHRVQQPIVFV